METVESLYCKSVIKPIEEERNKLRSELFKKGVFASEAEKEVLHKYDQLLIEKCKRLEELSREQYEDMHK